jgi:hypothetical protein
MLLVTQLGFALYKRLILHFTRNIGLMESNILIENIIDIMFNTKLAIPEVIKPYEYKIEPNEFKKDVPICYG